jgi:hypothetical protein
LKDLADCRTPALAGRAIGSSYSGSDLLKSDDYTHSRLLLFHESGPNVSAYAAVCGFGARRFFPIKPARAGDVAQAKSRLAALRKRFPANTLLINYWVPTVQATTR